MKGIVYDESMETAISEIIIKIPMEIQSEFENKYNINDLLIGHVSIVGIYKGIVKEEFITSNTFTYFQEADTRKGKQAETDGKIIKSNTPPVSNNILPNQSIEKLRETINTHTKIVGRVKKLESIPDASKRTNGKVTIVYLDENDSKKTVSVQLAKDDYNKAIEAHESGSHVEVIGEIEDNGKRKKLMTAESFSIID